MSEFSVESEGVDVERIMEQIRARIRADRGGEAADAQTRQQAGARAAQVVDPGGARSALAGRPRPEQEAPAPRPSESFEFDQDTIYRSSRGAIGRILYGVRKLLSPLLKFFFNVQPVAHALAAQSRINRQQAAFDDRVARLFDASSARLEAREEIDKLNHQVMLDLVAEMTRLSVEMKNHRMLVESVSARLDFFERQARARKSAPQPRKSSQASEPQSAETQTEGAEPTRRRRRRGRRRSGRTTAASETAAETPASSSAQTADAPTTAAPDTPAAAPATGSATAADAPSDKPEPPPQPAPAEPATATPKAAEPAPASSKAPPEPSPPTTPEPDTTPPDK